MKEGQEARVIAEKGDISGLLVAGGMHERRGLVYDSWPFQLDIDVEYQDWILLATCICLVTAWTLPCFCGFMRSPLSKVFTAWVYTRLHLFYWTIGYFTLLVLAFTISVLPDWTASAFLAHLGLFVEWVLKHLVSTIKCSVVLFAFWLVYKFRERVLMAAGLDYIKVFTWDISNPLGIGVRRRPVEMFIWKVDGLQSSTGKLMKANDVFVEVHLGDNEPMRTRVHNNAGRGCSIKESFQLNINEGQPHALVTLLLKDQSLLASTEIARLVLSTAELCGIEDQTGKRRIGFTYSPEYFVPLTLHPTGQIWIAVAPVDDRADDEMDSLLQDDDHLLPC